MTQFEESEIIEHGQDLKQNYNHVVDSINLLIFIYLLILVILTVWLFKHKRFPYIHETGLAVIYGLIFGVIIRYGFKRNNLKILNLTANNFSFDDIRDLPDSIHLKVPNHSQIFVYNYKNPKRAIDHNERDQLSEKATFDPEIFFNLLLPPIIFNAGYSMKKKHFFKNFGAILTFALLGTTIATFLTGGFAYLSISMFKSIKQYFSFTDCLFFGAIISATDPVTVLAIFNEQKINVNLYAVIFGESVLNDAVSIILAQAIDKYSGAASADKFDINQFFKCLCNFFSVFFGAFFIGFLMSCATALLTKFTYIRHHPSLETALFILMSYSTFLASEAAGLTGIISVLFCGVFQAHYTYNNLSKESKIQTKNLFHLMNFLSENFIFVYIGVSMFTFENHQWELSFISSSIVGIVLARAVSVYSLSYLINLTRSKRNKLNLNMQHLMVFSGLRGAMAFALAIRNTSTQARKLILTTTCVIIIITVIVCGGLTSKVLVWLGIKSEISEEESLKIENNANEESTEKKGRIKIILNKFGLFRAWHLFDNNFMKPLLTHSVPSLAETMPPFFLPLTKLLTTKEQEGLKNLKNNEQYLTAEKDNSSNNQVQINQVGSPMRLKGVFSNPFVNSVDTSEPEI